MGINFVVIVDNVLGRTQDEVNREFGVECFEDGTVIPQWELFTYNGKEYAIWNFPPRYFVIEEAIEKDMERWEALRKYLVRAMKFFGASSVRCTNDVCWFGLPSEEEDEDEARPGFYLPGELPEEYLEEPDYKKHPELKKVKELENLTW